MSSWTYENISSGKWPANRAKRTFTDELLARAHAEPLTVRCGRCGKAQECANFQASRRWWKEHRCRKAVA